MKKLLISLIAIVGCGVAMAEDYDVTATWTPVTLTNAGATLTYDLEYRVAAGADTRVENLPDASWAGVITANPGDTIEVRVRSDEELGGQIVNSPWTTYVADTGDVCLVVPAVPGGLNINVQCPTP